VDRRAFLGAAIGACAIPCLASLSMQLAPDMSRSLTKEERDGMTPSQVIDELKKGNERFRAAKMAPRDYLGEKRSSAGGQYPAAVILGCVDSRVPPEIVLHAGIGDTFIGRVAGNIVNDDMARTNVILVLSEIRRRSPLLEELEKKGSIKIAGAMYNVATGMVDFVG